MRNENKTVKITGMMPTEYVTSGADFAQTRNGAGRMKDFQLFFSFSPYIYIYISNPAPLIYSRASKNRIYTRAL